MVSISSAFRGVKWGSFVARETEANPWRLGWEGVQPSCAVGILQNITPCGKTLELPGTGYRGARQDSACTPSRRERRRT